MEDKILVALNADHTFECATTIIGREGEGNTSQFVITVPEKLSGCSVYLDFEKPNGEKMRSPKLEMENGKAVYDVVPYLLTDDGEIKVQVVLQTDDGQIWKSSIKKYVNQKSINALEDVPEKEDVFSEIQKSIDELEKSIGGFAVRGEFLRGENYNQSNRAPDDLKSLSDVGFYTGDGYSLIVTEGSVYGDYNVIHQIKIVNTTAADGTPTLYIRQYYDGGPHAGTWTDWKQIGGSGEETENRLTALEQAIADLTYTAIAITSFSANPSTAEMGSTVSSLTLSWGVNKTPSALTLDGSALTASTKTVNVTGAFTANKTWTLKATDERGATSTRTATLSFLNGVYYGVATEPSAYNSAFVLGLTKSLRSGKLTSFSANAGSGQYIYYCLPTRMGTCSFKVGGFDGGFSLIDTIEFTNASGYSENYYIYRSDNVSLGQTSVSVA